jgi:catechol 2,3-dioxygenase-like lactoylglutathione lyase family enzyme
MYCSGLGLKVVGQFKDHAGFDGMMLGREGMDYHLEFTHCPAHPVRPAPTPEDLIVFYLPNIKEWQSVCTQMINAGFKPVTSFNPYWASKGKTFADPDGYRIVLQNDEWITKEGG